jgi:hypothetical protein
MEVRGRAHAWRKRPFYQPQVGHASISPRAPKRGHRLDGQPPSDGLSRSTRTNANEEVANARLLEEEVSLWPAIYLAQSTNRTCTVPAWLQAPRPRSASWCGAATFRKAIRKANQGTSRTRTSRRRSSTTPTPTRASFLFTKQLRDSGLSGGRARGQAQEGHLVCASPGHDCPSDYSP